MDQNEISGDINEQYEKTIFTLASAISAILSSIKDRDQRLDAIIKLNRPVEELKKVYEVALSREDYETCDVIKQFIDDVQGVS